MSKRNTDIIVENVANTLRIYSDMSSSQIESVEGVVSVDDNHMECHGYLYVVVDKRYDIESVIKDIEDMAMSAVNNG
jgi:hypothetical protein